MEEIRKVCKVCPLACDLKIKEENLGNGDYQVQGNRCNRGREFAIREVTKPSRVLTSRVLLKNGPMNRLPVKTNGVIEEGLVEACMDIIKVTEVRAPVERGQIIIENILNTGVDLVAARRVNKL